VPFHAYLSQLSTSRGATKARQRDTLLPHQNTSFCFVFRWHKTKEKYFCTLSIFFPFFFPFTHLFLSCQRAEAQPGKGANGYPPPPKERPLVFVLFLDGIIRNTNIVLHSVNFITLFLFHALLSQLTTNSGAIEGSNRVFAPTQMYLVSVLFLGSTKRNQNIFLPRCKFVFPPQINGLVAPISRRKKDPVKKRG